MLLAIFGESAACGRLRVKTKTNRTVRKARKETPKRREIGKVAGS